MNQQVFSGAVLARTITITVLAVSGGSVMLEASAQTTTNRGQLSRPSQALPAVIGERKKSARRIALEASEQGQMKIARARKQLGNALVAHSIAPLAALRLAAGLSQKQLCEQTGIAQPHLSRLENGKVAQPDVETLQRLSAALGVGLEVVIQANHDSVGSA